MSKQRWYQKFTVVSFPSILVHIYDHLKCIHTHRAIIQFHAERINHLETLKNSSLRECKLIIYQLKKKLRLDR